MGNCRGGSLIGTENHRGLLTDHGQINHVIGIVSMGAYCLQGF